MAAWLKIRSCWCLTSPPWLQRGETVINSHRLSVCWTLSSVLERCPWSWDTTSYRGFGVLYSCIEKKKYGYCIFSRVFYFLPALWACWTWDLFAHRVTREISGVTGQDSKMRRCHTLPGRAGSFPAGRKHLQDGVDVSPDTEGWVKGLLSKTQYRWGKGAGQGMLGRVYKAPGQKRVEL